MFNQSTVLGKRGFVCDSTESDKQSAKGFVTFERKEPIVNKF